jgi:hypothetical protein
VAGDDLQLTDRLDRTGRVLGDHPRLADRTLRAAASASIASVLPRRLRVCGRLIDLDHADACAAQ